jgi:plastocyanin
MLASSWTSTVTMAPDGTQEITLTVADDYVFVPDKFKVTTGQVRVTLKNTAKQLTHNIQFTPVKGPVWIPEEIPILRRQPMLKVWFLQRPV